MSYTFSHHLRMAGCYFTTVCFIDIELVDANRGIDFYAALLANFTYQIRRNGSHSKRSTRSIKFQMSRGASSASSKELLHVVHADINFAFCLCGAVAENVFLHFREHINRRWQFSCRCH